MSWTKKAMDKAMNESKNPDENAKNRDKSTKVAQKSPKEMLKDTSFEWIEGFTLEKIKSIDAELAESILRKGAITKQEHEAFLKKVQETKPKTDSENGGNKNTPQSLSVVHRMSVFGILMSVLSALLFLGILLALLYKKPASS
jgi:hypothetical protein